MTTESKAIIRCAIYTRESSEEGLEQSFNSLDAQREACAAFIASQRHEGWRALPALYDDGGYSGGNLERPALTRLLDDIQTNKVDTIVVYKVDRLTRSPGRFRQDRRSAGRARSLLRIRYSAVQHHDLDGKINPQYFALIRAIRTRGDRGKNPCDKIAASKRKGMWMGGCAFIRDLRQKAAGNGARWTATASEES
jgi:site-specific DNA recombinase